MDNITHIIKTNSTIPLILKDELCGIFLEVALWISVVSLLINIFSISAILPSRLRCKLAYRLVINLCFSDAVLTFVMAGYLGTIKLGVIWSKEAKYIAESVFDVCSLVSLFTLIAMSLDLYIRMVFPLKYLTLTNVLAFRAIIMYIWILSVIPYLGLDVIVAASSKPSSTPLLVTVVSDGFQSTCINSVCALLGLVIIIILYSRIFHDIYFLKARQHRDSFSLKKAAVTITLVILAYFLCYLPLWIYIFIEQVSETDLSHDARWFVLECLAYILYALNTLCDPIIYSLRLSVIRDVYSKALHKLRTSF